LGQNEPLRKYALLIMVQISQQSFTQTSAQWLDTHIVKIFTHIWHSLNHAPLKEEITEPGTQQQRVYQYEIVLYFIDSLEKKRHSFHEILYCVLSLFMIIKHNKQWMKTLQNMQIYMSDATSFFKHWHPVQVRTKMNTHLLV
jgi:hypothetical protein